MIRSCLVYLEIAIASRSLQTILKDFLPESPDAPVKLLAVAVAANQLSGRP